ncbi:MAG: hypothetical protein INH43_01590 [Acidobacteriaceae bacterium]|jgi:hypothetical protein|nr:hypothetical protein [Acidobacteriaceae bacterium]
MRREPDFFGEDEELDLVYIAKRLLDAQRLEEKLTAAGVEYLVEPDEYRGGFLFQTVRTGAFFYVRGAEGDALRQQLAGWGFKPQPLGEN